MALFTDVVQHSFVVSNIERSMRFWCDIIGFKVEKVLPLDVAKMREMTGLPAIQGVRVALLWMGPHNLELMEYSPQTLKRPANRMELGSSHVAFWVDDMQKTRDALTAKGVKLVTPAGHPFGCYFEDPDGITVELINKRPLPAAAQR